MSIRSHISVWVSLGVLALFYIGHYLFGHDAAKTVVDALVIGSAVTISLTWARGALAAIRDGIQNGAANIMVSTWSVWVVILAYFTYVQLYNNVAGRPESWRLGPAGGTFSTFFFLSGAYAILAPVNNAQLERPSLVGWFAAVAVGGVVAGVMITLGLLKLLSYG